MFVTSSYEPIEPVCLKRLIPTKELNCELCIRVYVAWGLSADEQHITCEDVASIWRWKVAHTLLLYIIIIEDIS